MKMETTQQEQQAAPTTASPCGWAFYAGKPVLLQLREPYWGVEGDYTPTTSKNEEGAVIGVVAVPFLSGILHIQPDGENGVLLVIQRPFPDRPGFAYVALKPSDVLYCTHLNEREPSRIVAP